MPGRPCSAGMGQYGSMWGHMGPFGFLFVHMGPYWSMWTQPGPYGVKLIHMGSYLSILVHMNPYGPIWVHMGSQPQRSWTRRDSVQCLGAADALGLRFPIVSGNLTLSHYACAAKRAQAF